LRRKGRKKRARERSGKRVWDIEERKRDGQLGLELEWEMG